MKKRMVQFTLALLVCLITSCTSVRTKVTPTI